VDKELSGGGGDPKIRWRATTPFFFAKPISRSNFIAFVWSALAAKAFFDTERMAVWV